MYYLPGAISTDRKVLVGPSTADSNPPKLLFHRATPSAWKSILNNLEGRLAPWFKSAEGWFRQGACLLFRQIPQWQRISGRGTSQVPHWTHHQLPKRFGGRCRFLSRHIGCHFDSIPNWGTTHHFSRGHPKESGALDKKGSRRYGLLDRRARRRCCQFKRSLRDWRARDWKCFSYAVEIQATASSSTVKAHAGNWTKATRARSSTTCNQGKKGHDDRCSKRYEVQYPDWWVRIVRDNRCQWSEAVWSLRKWSRNVTCRPCPWADQGPRVQRRWGWRVEAQSQGQAQRSSAENGCTERCQKWDAWQFAEGKHLVAQARKTFKRAANSGYTSCVDRFNHDLVFHEAKVSEGVTCDDLAKMDLLAHCRLASPARSSTQVALGSASGRHYDNTLVKLADINADAGIFEAPYNDKRFDKPWLFIWEHVVFDEREYVTYIEGNPRFRFITTWDGVVELDPPNACNQLREIYARSLPKVQENIVTTSTASLRPILSKTRERLRRCRSQQQNPLARLAPSPADRLVSSNAGMHTHAVIPVTRAKVRRGRNGAGGVDSGGPAEGMAHGTLTIAKQACA